MADKKLDPEQALAAKLAELDAKLEALGELETELHAKLAQSGGGGISKSDLQEIVSAAAKPANVLAEKLIPENKIHPHKGPFEYPEGGIAKPKPKFHRAVYLNSQEQQAKRMTPGEILTLNALSQSLGRGQKRIARDGKWKAYVTDNNEALHIVVPMKSLDDRMDLPSISQIALELTDGERALDTNELAQEVARLRAEVQSLQAAV